MSQINVWMRKKQKMITVVLCCVCMVTFVLGPALMSMVSTSKFDGGRIFDKKISGRTIESFARRLYAFIGQRMSTNKLIGIAWETLIFQEEAKRYGISVGEADMLAALGQSFPATNSTSYDEVAYTAHLRKIGMTQSDYEETMRTLLVAQKLRTTVQSSVTLSTDEAWLWYSRENETVKTSYIQIPVEPLSQFVSIKEGELKMFYDDNANTPSGQGPYGSGYLAPEMAKIEYIMARYDVLAEKAEVTQDQIKTYYDDHKEDYLITPSKDDAKEKAPTDADPVEDVAKAETPANADKKTPDEEKSPEYKPLKDVAEEIEKTLRTKLAHDKVDEIMKDVNKTIWKALDTLDTEGEENPTIDLAAIADKFGLERKVTGFFSSKELPPGLPGATKLSQRIFGQGQDTIGHVSITLESSDGKFVYKTITLKRAKSAPYELVKTGVEKHLRLKKAGALALEIAGPAAAASTMAEATEMVKAAMDKLQGKVDEGVEAKEIPEYYVTGETDFFGRVMEFRGNKYHNLAELPGKFDSVHYAEQAFALKPGEIGMAMDGEEINVIYLLERTDTKSVSRETFDAQKGWLINNLLRKKQTEVLDSWNKDLRKRAHPSEKVMRYLSELENWKG